MQSGVHFRGMKHLIYLDWASAAPVSKSAQKAFLKGMALFGNPSSPHTEGEKARVLLEDSRRTIARLASIKTDGVIFTSGATEANALAIQGHVQALLEADRKPEGMHLLYLPTSHASVVETMLALEAKGIAVEALAITEGKVDLDALKKQIRPETVLISMDVVCGETGTRWDTRDVRRVLNTFGNRPLLHVDASQAGFSESLELGHLGADLMTLDAQKVGGVRGIGALLRAHPLIPLSPIIRGGGQEQGLRSGTESPALASAFAVALAEVQEGKEVFIAKSEKMRQELLAELVSGFPEMSLNAGDESVSHIVNVSFPGRDTDYAVMLLSEAGFAVSTKSACETDVDGSRVVLTLMSDPVLAVSTLRISWGPTTHAKDLRDFARALIRTIHFLDSSVLSAVS